MARTNPLTGAPSGVLGLKNLPGPLEERVFPAGVSDGNKNKWPSSPYRPSDDSNYRRRLAQAWAEKDGSARPSKPYSFQ